MAAILLLTAPVFADDGPPSMISIATALRGGHPQDAELIATQMMAAQNVSPLDMAYLHLNRGLAREQLGRRDDAVADFNAAIDAKVLPTAELSRALFDRGVTLDEMNRTEQAIADYSQAIVLAPRYATALNNRGNAYRRSKKFALARADYEAALAAGDDEPEYPLYGLGRIAEAQGDAVLAQSFYRKALAANESYTPATERMAALTANAAPATYSIHPPREEATAPDAAPDAAPITPVTEAQATPRVDLHTPPPPPAPVQSPPRPPEKQMVQAAPPPFGLRPAIPYSARPAKAAKPPKPPVRVASLEPPQLEDAAPSGGKSIQLGAWRDQGDAATGWNRLVGRAGGLLSGLSPHIVAANIPGKGRFWRLRALPGSGTDAAALCAQLKDKGIACIVAKD